MLKKEIIRFLIVGGVGTSVNYAVFLALHLTDTLPYIYASTIGFFAGVIVGYFFNKAWTFEVTEKSKLFIIKYGMAYTLSLFLGLGLLKFQVEYLHFAVWFANFVMIGFTTCTNFIFTKLWVFRNAK